MTIRQRTLTEETVTHVEFSLSDLSYPFVAASAESGGHTILEEIIPRGERAYAEFYTVMNTDPEEVLRLAAEHESAKAELLDQYDSGGLFEFVVTDNCPAVFLGEQGALPREVESTDGQGRITAEIPAATDETSVIKSFLNAHPDAKLTMKRQQPYETPIFSHREFQQAIEDQLTDRQQEAIAVAHSSGYYEWPRDTTADDLADELGIATATFTEHLRAAEQKLISVFFETP